MVMEPVRKKFLSSLFNSYIVCNMGKLFVLESDSRNSNTGFLAKPVRVSVVTTGGVILITRFAFLSPNEAESFSSNNPSPNTGVKVMEHDKKRIANIRPMGFCNISCEVWFIIYFFDFTT